MKTALRHSDRITFIRLLVLVVLGLVTLGGMSLRPALGQTDGTITGVVTNATTGTPVADLPVTLSQFTSPTAESVDTTSTTDAQGRYTFSNVDASDGFVYATSVLHAGVFYSSGMLRFDGATSLTGDITVFDSTDDQSIVNLQARGIIVTSADEATGLVRITDVFAFEIAGDRTLIADENGRTVRFSVPETATQVSPRPGFDFGTPSIEGATIFATSALRPGSANASLDYTLPYSGSTLELPVVADYPTATVRILVPIDLADDVSVTAEGAPLLDQGVVAIDTRDYHVWTTEALAAGDRLELSIANLPRANVERNRLRTVEPAILAFAALLIASSVAAWIVTRRGLMTPRLDPAGAAYDVPLGVRRQQLADELRQLEQDRTEERIDDAAYRAERRTILEELRLISRLMRGETTDE